MLETKQNKMNDLRNLNEFRQQLADTFAEKFREQFGDDPFIICRTRDKSVYDSANKSMYSWYLRILNSIETIHEHWTYKIDAFSVEVENSTDRVALLESLKESDNVIMWAFENIKI